MKIVWSTNKYLRNILVMIGFGILSYLLGKIQFYVPGLAGGMSDLREVPILISVLYLPNWIYLVGVSLITTLGTPSDGIEMSTLLMHCTASIFAWFFYAFIRKRLKDVYLMGSLWAGMVLIYYLIFLIPTMIIVYNLYGVTPASEMIMTYKKVLYAFSFELFTATAVTTLYMILYLMVKIMEGKNFELRNALKKAEESDRLKSAFLANMSHEIRTPMNGIIGFSDLLSAADLNQQKRKEYIDLIISSSNQLLSIINDILDISRIEAGLAEIIRSGVSVNILFDNLGRYYSSKASAKNLRFEIRKPLKEAESYFLTDRGKLQQILDNLLNNALKFTSEGQIILGYEINSDWIRFYVEDSGIGISEENQARIFGRFIQVETAHSRTYGGTGLGLSISKGLVELLGGKIGVTSEEGKGSVFSFTLPFQNVPKETLISLAQEPNLIKSAFASSTIMVAEDEANNFKYIKELLEGRDAKILHAENGREAVELCKEHPEIDLVLLDIKMPVMNGLAAASQIRRLRPNLPIIAQTAYARAGDKQLAIDAGCNDYLAKPITKKVFLDAIEKYCKI